MNSTRKIGDIPQTTIKHMSNSHLQNLVNCKPNIYIEYILLDNFVLYFRNFLLYSLHTWIQSHQIHFLTFASFKIPRYPVTIHLVISANICSEKSSRRRRVFHWSDAVYVYICVYTTSEKLVGFLQHPLAGNYAPP